MLRFKDTDFSFSFLTIVMGISYCFILMQNPKIFSVILEA